MSPLQVIHASKTLADGETEAGSCGQAISLACGLEGLLLKGSPKGDPLKGTVRVTLKGALKGMVEHCLI